MAVGDDRLCQPLTVTSMQLKTSVVGTGPARFAMSPFRRGERCDVDLPGDAVISTCGDDEGGTIGVGRPAESAVHPARRAGDRRDVTFEGVEVVQGG